MVEKMDSRTGWEKYCDRIRGPIDEQHVAMARADFLSDLARLEHEAGRKGVNDAQARETVIGNMEQMGRMPGQAIDPDRTYFYMMVQGYEGSPEKLEDEIK
jgi:hypothetical protein